MRRTAGPARLRLAPPPVSTHFREPRYLAGLAIKGSRGECSVRLAPAPDPLPGLRLAHPQYVDVRPVIANRRQFYAVGSRHQADRDAHLPPLRPGATGR